MSAFGFSCPAPGGIKWSCGGNPTNAPKVSTFSASEQSTSPLANNNLFEGDTVATKRGRKTAEDGDEVPAFDRIPEDIKKKCDERLGEIRAEAEEDARITKELTDDFDAAVAAEEAEDLKKALAAAVDKTLTDLKQPTPPTDSHRTTVPSAPKGTSISLGLPKMPLYQPLAALPSFSLPEQSSTMTMPQWHNNQYPTFLPSSTTLPPPLSWTNIIPVLSTTGTIVPRAPSPPKPKAIRISPPRPRPVKNGFAVPRFRLSPPRSSFPSLLEVPFSRVKTRRAENPVTGVTLRAEIRRESALMEGGVTDAAWPSGRSRGSSNSNTIAEVRGTNNTIAEVRGTNNTIAKVSGTKEKKPATSRNQKLSLRHGVSKTRGEGKRKEKKELKKKAERVLDYKNPALEEVNHSWGWGWAGRIVAAVVFEVMNWQFDVQA